MPFTVIGFPDESSNETVTPGIADPDAPPPASPALPVMLEVQVDSAGAVTVSDWLAGVNVVVTLFSTELPEAETVAVLLVSEAIGPEPLGQA